MISSTACTLVRLPPLGHEFIFKKTDRFSEPPKSSKTFSYFLLLHYDPASCMVTKMRAVPAEPILQPDVTIVADINWLICSSSPLEITTMTMRNRSFVETPQPLIKSLA